MLLIHQRIITLVYCCVLICILLRVYQPNAKMHRLPTRKQPRNHTHGTNDDPNSKIMKDEAAYESLLTQAVAIMVFHAMES